MHPRSIAAAACIAVSFCAGWIVQGWRLTAQLEAERGVSATAQAEALRIAQDQTAAAIKRAAMAQIDLAEAERLLLIAREDLDATQRRLINDIQADGSLQRPGIPSERLRGIEAHWSAD